MTRPAPLACVECRRSHVKCDGILPTCTRCATNHLACGYKPSQRGRCRRSQHARSSARSNGDAVVPSPLPPTPVTQTSSIGESGGYPINSPGHPSAAAQVQTTPVETVSYSNARIYGIDKELLIDSFYTCFHPAHPFLVPRSFYSRQQYPAYLEHIVCLIGQLYILGSDEAQIDAEIETLAKPADVPVTLSGIQALLLCSIVMHSLHNPNEAFAYLARAHAIAQELSLNSPTFPSPTNVEEESKRRTWWELYTVDAYFAALHRQPSYIDNCDAIHLPLPGSSKSYNAGTPDPWPPSVVTMERRVFSQDPLVERFSSFAYRIEAIRLLRRVLNLFHQPKTGPDAIDTIDNAIASWKHYLPDSGLMNVEELSEMDQLYFQAHAFVHTATILLHFPLSGLPPKVPSLEDIACAKNHTRGFSLGSTHTMKTIAASKEIANIASVPVPVTSHSPLFMCALNLATIVQLAAGSMHTTDSDNTTLHRHRDRVILLLGVLTQMGRRWRIGKHSAAALRCIADRVFAATDEPDAAVTQNMDDMWSDLTWFDLFSPEHFNSIMTQAESSEAELTVPEVGG